MGFQYIIWPYNYSRIIIPNKTCRAFCTHEEVFHENLCGALQRIYDMNISSTERRETIEIVFCAIVYHIIGIMGNALVVRFICRWLRIYILLRRCWVIFPPRCVADWGWSALLLVISLKEWRPELRSKCLVITRIGMCVFVCVRVCKWVCLNKKV